MALTIRDRVSRVDWFAVALLVGGPLVLLWPLWLGGQVLFWGTPLLQFYPWRVEAISLLRSGQFPWWNPLLGNGAPLAANLQSALFYPPNWILWFLPIERAVGWLAILHLIWAGIGMRLFLREIGLRRFGALLGAVSFMLCGYLVSRLEFFSIASAYPWLPWMLLAAERLLSGKRYGVASLALAVGLQLLAGHAQTSFYSLMVLGAYSIWRIAFGSRPGGARREPVNLRHGVRLVVAVALGFALAAVQLLPSWELSRESQRAGGMNYDFAMTYSMWPWRVLSLASPDLYGNPASGDYWGYGYYWEDDGYVGVIPLALAGLAVVRWWKRRRRSAPESVEACGGPGQTVPLWSILALAALVLALGRNTPIYPLVYRWVPGFNLFQAPARLLAIYTFSMAVLAGIGAEEWIAARRRPGRGLRLALTGAAGALLAAILATRLPQSAQAEVRLSTLSAGTVWLAAWAVAGLILALRRPLPGCGLSGLNGHGVEAFTARHWANLALLVVALDLIWTGMRLNPTVDPALYHTPPQDEAAIRAAVGDGRILVLPQTAYDLQYKEFFLSRSFQPAGGQDWSAVRETWLPDLSLTSGIASANNYDPLLPASYSSLMAAIGNAEPEAALRLARVMAVRVVISREPLGEPPAVAHGRDFTAYWVPDALPRAWLVAHAQWVPDSRMALSAVQRPDFDLQQTVVLEGSSTEVGSDSGSNSRPGQVRWMADQADEVVLQVSADRPGYLVLADTAYPGWQAEVDGRPAEWWRANVAFRAVAVPAGQHEVRFVYRPESWRLGAVGSGIALLILGAWLWIGRR